jgi:hypothetical protein
MNNGEVEQAYNISETVWQLHATGTCIVGHVMHLSDQCDKTAEHANQQTAANDKPGPATCAAIAYGAALAGIHTIQPP